MPEYDVTFDFNIVELKKITTLIRSLKPYVNKV
jgi:hypothetical protein